MDKSFEGLLISVLIHFALALFFIYAKLPPPVDNRPTQITLIEKEKEQDKPQRTKPALITDAVPEQPHDTNKDIKQQADLLEAFTQRVKKQFQAQQRADQTRNASKLRGQKNQQQVQKKLGLTADEKGQTGPTGEQQQKVLSLNTGVSTIRDRIPGVESANMSVLNTDQFTYWAFYSRSLTQIGNRWSPSLRGYLQVMPEKMLREFISHSRTAEYEFLLMPEGQFFRAIIVRSSGDKGFDEINIQAFKDAAPFPHPPQEMIRDDGFIHYHMSFIVDFTPPSFGLGGNG